MTGHTGTGGGAWVVTGEPGCGRTAFLENAARTDGAARSSPARAVVRVAGGPAASAAPLSGLRALLRALGAPAEGRPDPDVPDASGPVLLTALLAASAEAPLLVCADDAHLWDAASRAAVGRAARRLRADGPVRMLLSVAGHRAVDAQFAGLPVVRVAPLPPAEAAALVEEAAGGAVDRAVRDALVDAGDGNPALLLAMVRRLSPARLRGHGAPLPPPADAALLGGPVGGLLTRCPRDQEDLLLAVAAALRDEDADDPRDARVDIALALRAAERLGTTTPGQDGTLPHIPPHTAPPGTRVLPEALVLADGEVGFHSDLLRRAVYAAARPERRRAAHRALAGALEDAGSAGLPVLLHRARGTPAPRSATALRLALAAGDPVRAASPGLRCAAFARAAELAGDRVRRAEWCTAAAEQALLGGRTHRALRLLDSAFLAPALPGYGPLDPGPDDPGPDGSAAAAVRGRVEFVRGMTLLCDGPVDEARASLLLAARLLAAPAPRQAQNALLAASDAAWAAGDAAGCLHALSGGGESAVGDDPSAPNSPRAQPVSAGRRTLVRLGGGRAAAIPEAAAGADVSALRGADEGVLLPVYRAGLRALLEGRFAEAARPLRRLVSGADHARTADDAEAALRAAAAALLLGDLGSARRTGARALAVARTVGATTALARAREYLAYAELRSGRHALARTYAEEGLRTALRTGQGNKAAQYRAVLALAASIESGPDLVARYASAALETARQHGLVQAATMAEWATARADLARGRPREAADRLGPLVRPGTRRGHFAVWMLAVPCFVEAVAATAGRPLAGSPTADVTGHARAAADATGATGASEAVAVAAVVVEEFARWAGFGADPQAPAQLLRCRALLAPADRADALYRAAVDLHDATGGGDFERARTELLHGKWLRRRRRLREARDRLGAALVGFERCGARVWADQARAELRAGGAAPAGRAGAGGLSALTPQQLRIAHFVADGATNREVALTLSVSTRTVDYHLRKVFAVLGVRSRVELARLVDRAR
ncbi:LuxR C-terminal-related transcriptional regulator [Streptomyces sp. NPDC048481]|uniref:helix-turn-helix transcriptional regulator n=1 Tax=Streptomyces sp. NPDC048481 TaxID=3365557 RepID=UPI003713E279